MGEEVKKISFGFSKLIKRTNIVSSKLSQAKPEEKKVEFIDCLESKAIKLKDHVEPVERLLVIPMRNQLQVPSIIEQDQKTDNIQSQTRPLICQQDPQGNVILQPSKMDIADIDPSVDKNKIDPLQLSVNDDTSPHSNSTMNNTLTLDEIAAKEILEDLKRKSNLSDKPILNLSVPLSNNTPEGKKESSLEDYESIPVTEFGIAMLRGMGWAPGKGIGKNEKLVTPSLPTLRPKGMGLGADKVVKDATITGNTITTEDLKMVKGSFIRVIVGSYKDSYGQIEGFDDESGRLIIKLALRNMTVSLNEFMVQLVDKVEFTKNSKVLNVSKYEQYKDEGDKVDSNREKSTDQLKYEKESHEKYSSNETYKSRPNPKYGKLEKSIKKNVSSSESELSDSRTASIKVEKLSTSRKSRDRSYKLRRGSSSDDNHRKTRSPVCKSQSKGSNAVINSNREASIKKHKKKSSHKSRSVTGIRKRSNSWHSSSSSRTSSSSDYIRRKHKKKKPSSRKPKSRSRSRTPRKHGKSKKHKKSKYE